jgi:hypothetical protein
MKLKTAIRNNWKEKIKFVTRKWKEGGVKKSSQQELKEEENTKINCC